MTLLDEIAEAEAHLALLKRRATAATCSEIGCDMQMIGGTNAGCGERCGCSAEVKQCTRCGDCDYGEPDRSKVIAACRERRGED